MRRVDDERAARIADDSKNLVRLSYDDTDDLLADRAEDKAENARLRATVGAAVRIVDYYRLSSATNPYGSLNQSYQIIEAARAAGEKRA